MYWPLDLTSDDLILEGFGTHIEILEMKNLKEIILDAIKL
jgi:hypothetical protein